MLRLPRCFLLLPGIAASIVAAQSTKAELFGVIRDPGRLPVSAATVEDNLVSILSLREHVPGKDNRKHERMLKTLETVQLRK